jgi:predicted nucleotide-binding protein
MDKDEAIEVLDRALQKIPLLRNGPPGSAGHIAFVQSTGLDVARIFGPDSIVSKNFGAVDYWSTGSILVFPSTFERDTTRARQNAFLRGLDMAEGILQSAREQLGQHGVDRLLRAGRVYSDGPRIFVSHGGETVALSKLERFLRACGAHPVVVSHEPSEGLSLDDLVDKRMEDADCVIILATNDDEVVAGGFQPRANVIHEIGLAQKIHTDRIIYLKEVDCRFPSNIAPKVWENFVPDNMEAAFEKVLKELRVFGLL